MKILKFLQIEMILNFLSKQKWKERKTIIQPSFFSVPYSSFFPPINFFPSLPLRPSLQRKTQTKRNIPAHSSCPYGLHHNTNSSKVPTEAEQSSPKKITISKQIIQTNPPTSHNRNHPPPSKQQSTTILSQNFRAKH